MPRSPTTDASVQQAIGKAIRETRQHRGMSQETLAEAVGIQPETASRYETGSTALSVPTLFRIAEVLDVSVVALLGQDEGELHAIGPEENNLLSGWRKVDSEARQAILTLIDKLSR